MSQENKQVQAQSTIVVFAALIVIIALSVLAIRLFTARTADSGTAAPATDILARESIQRQQWLERHMNPVFDGISDAQPAPEVAAADAMRAHWVQQHMSPVFDGSSDAQSAPEAAAADAMRAHWVAQHMSPVFEPNNVAQDTLDPMTEHWIERHMNPVFDN